MRNDSQISISTLRDLVTKLDIKLLFLFFHNIRL